MEVKNLRREGLLFLMWVEASIMWFNSSALVLDFTAYTRNSYVPKDGSSKELGQLTSVAKQLDPAAQSSGCENVEWEMQLPAYQNEGAHNLAAATALTWCGEEHLTTLPISSKWWTFRHMFIGPFWLKLSPKTHPWAMDMLLWDILYINTPWMPKYQGIPQLPDGYFAAYWWVTFEFTHFSSFWNINWSPVLIKIK
jgi:hypothetical protein